MRSGLTPRLAQTLEVIRRHIAGHGMAPTRGEIADALGIRSRGAVNAMIDRLEERGFIARQRNSSRAIEILEQPGFSHALEAEIAMYCQNVGITRPVFDQRAAESLLRGRA